MLLQLINQIFQFMLRKKQLVTSLLRRKHRHNLGRLVFRYLYLPDFFPGNYKPQFRHASFANPAPYGKGKEDRH